MDQQQEQMAQMIQNLREDLREHRADTREDIKNLEGKTETWHKEVRDEFKTVKDRLTVIETQTATIESGKKRNFEKFSSYAALIIAAITALIHFYK